jgi:hypothetical protein
LELASNLLDKTRNEISSQAAFAGWSHTNSIITDMQRALALRRYRKGDPNDADCAFRICVLQGVHNELVNNQAKGNGSLVGQSQWGELHLDLDTFFALTQTTAQRP